MTPRKPDEHVRKVIYNRDNVLKAGAWSRWGEQRARGMGVNGIEQVNCKIRRVIRFTVDFWIDACLDSHRYVGGEYFNNLDH